MLLRSLLGGIPLLPYGSEDTPLKATATWKHLDADGRSHQITVETIRGVPGAGETVSASESLEAWRARHALRVADALATFPAQ